MNAKYHHYKVWAINAQGASDKMTGEFSSAANATQAARLFYGRGWEIHVVGVLGMNKGENEVKKFTVRK